MTHYFRPYDPIPERPAVKFPLGTRFARRFVDPLADNAFRSGQELLGKGEDTVDADFEMACQYQQAAELLIGAGLARIVDNWIDAGCPPEDDGPDDVGFGPGGRPM